MSRSRAARSPLPHAWSKTLTSDPSGIHDLGRVQCGTTVRAVSKFPSNCRVTAEMDVRLTRGAAAGVLMWTGIGQAQVPAITSETPTIVVYVEDRTGLRPDVTESAEKELVRIYALAGVHAVWKNTVPVTAGTENDGVPNVTVVVLDAAATERLAARSGPNAKLLGAAARGAMEAPLGK